MMFCCPIKKIEDENSRNNLLIDSPCISKERGGIGNSHFNSILTSFWSWELFHNKAPEHCCANTITGSTVSSSDNSSKKIVCDGSVDTSISSKGDHASSSITYTVYLIRHGEASHNVEEKAAQKKALDEALKEGLSADDPETIRRVKLAREKVLEDEALFDAPLSENGKNEAREAHKKLQQLLQRSKENEATSSCSSDNPVPLGLAEPTRVLVSPLQRTLQTAALIFPDNKNVCVREELRERDTGRPADIRSSTDVLIKRKTFANFRLSQLRNASLIRRGYEVELLPQLLQEESENNTQHNSDPIDFCVSLDDASPSTNDEHKHVSENFVKEDETMVRERALQVFRLLRQDEESKDHRSVAIITHKGFLRGLERGPLHRPNAPEFKNCEIRVYNFTFNNDENDENLDSSGYNLNYDEHEESQLIPEKIERIV